jgi:hypothetical protein
MFLLKARGEFRRCAKKVCKEGISTGKNVYAMQEVHRYETGEKIGKDIGPNYVTRVTGQLFCGFPA